VIGGRREPLGLWDLCSSRKPRLPRAPFDFKGVILRGLGPVKLRRRLINRRCQKSLL